MRDEKMYWSRPGRTQWDEQSPLEGTDLNTLEDVCMACRTSKLIGVTTHLGDRCLVFYGGWFCKPPFEITDKMAEWIGEIKPNESVWSLISGESNE